MDLPLAFAFGAGMLATVNPCGFAMLPAYLGYFLGLDDDSSDTFAAVVRAVVVAFTVAAGFVVVFGIIGFLIAQFSLAVNRYLPWFTIVLGVALAALGVAMLRGFSPTVRLPKLDRGTGSRQLTSMFLFGMSYAIASLSCTMPIFGVTISTTLTRSSFLGVVVVFLVYALGMAVVLAGITVSLALARQSFVQSLRQAIPHIQRIAGGLLVVAGLFLAYYGWYQLQVLTADNLSPAGPGRFAYELQVRLTDAISTVGATRLGAIVVIVLTLIVFATYATRNRRGA